MLGTGWNTADFMETEADILGTFLKKSNAKLDMKGKIQIDKITDFAHYSNTTNMGYFQSLGKGPCRRKASRPKFTSSMRNLFLTLLGLYYLLFFTILQNRCNIFVLL